ncbi:MAG: EMC3/TMCO1 family protein [Candidatus Hadarchaeales archaeon]
MKTVYSLAIAVVLILVAAYAVQATAGEKTRNLERIIAGIDSKVREMRINRETTGTVSHIADLFKSTFSEYENDNPDLYSSIVAAFGETQSEENIFILRNNILAFAASSGISLTFVRQHSLLIVFFISALTSLTVTLFTREKVDWRMVGEYRAKISAFAKEYRDAARKGDKKRMMKLSERMGEINRMQSVVMVQTMKPTLYYFVPLIVLWYILLSMFSGWVFAFLPFRLDLPFVGPLVTFGVGWWYFITYLGCSTFFRGLLIRESAPAETAGGR